jgi:hypothetical protein
MDLQQPNPLFSEPEPYTQIQHFETAIISNQTRSSMDTSSTKHKISQTSPQIIPDTSKLESFFSTYTRDNLSPPPAKRTKKTGYPKVSSHPFFYPSNHPCEKTNNSSPESTSAVMEAEMNLLISPIVSSRLSPTISTQKKVRKSHDFFEDVKILVEGYKGLPAFKKVKDLTPKILLLYIFFLFIKKTGYTKDDFYFFYTDISNLFKNLSHLNNHEIQNPMSLLQEKGFISRFNINNKKYSWMRDIDKKHKEQTQYYFQITEKIKLFCENIKLKFLDPNAIDLECYADNPCYNYLFIFFDTLTRQSNPSLTPAVTQDKYEQYKSTSLETNPFGFFSKVDGSNKITDERSNENENEKLPNEEGELSFDELLNRLNSGPPFP